MVSTLLSFGALFTSALFFLMGGGVLNTLLSLRMTQMGFSTPIIGFTLACYFLGLVLGYFLCHHLIFRVGHIRSFAVFAAATTIIIILHGLYISPIIWAILRFFSGIANFGLFMVIESWLNECTENQTRGRVFSIYMTLTYMGIGIGQQILNFGDVGGQDLFLVAALLFSLSLIPVSTTQSIHPDLPQPTRYTFKALFEIVPHRHARMLCSRSGKQRFFFDGAGFRNKNRTICPPIVMANDNNRYRRFRRAMDNRNRLRSI